MDNISHSVAGLAVGEMAHRSLPSEAHPEDQRRRRRLLLVTAWLASNFPDLDLMLTPLLPAPIGYLLHHRGHTHTLLYAIPQALLIWAGIWLLWPSARRLLRTSPGARKGFLLALAGSFIVHLLMDFLNSYGLHPFHPFDSRWVYGDMVFIIEPLFWVAFGVPLILSMRRGWVKAAWLLALVGVLTFFTLKGFLAWWSLVFLALLALALGLLQRRAVSGARAALLAAFAFMVAFAGVQHTVSRHAYDMIEADANMRDPAGRMLDVALTAFPANPVCWSFVSVESDEQAGTYRLRRGQMSVLPSVLRVAQCPSGFLEPAGSSGSAMTITTEETGTLEHIRRLKAENCHFDAWLRFARMPSVDARSASDMRYASSKRGNFSAMDFEEVGRRACSPHVPQWGYPRADLLQDEGSR